MAKETISIEANLLWVIAQDRKSEYWIGVCEVLKISVQGKTLGELHEIIEEALHALFSDLLERRELELFLSQHKWKLRGSVPDSPARARFDIPYNIERRRQNDFQGVLG